MRVLRFVAGGLLAVAALVGSAGAASADGTRVTVSPACSDWPSGAVCAAPDNRGRYSVPDNNEWPLASANDAKGEF